MMDINMNINFNDLIKEILPYIIAMLLAYAISTIIYLFLPKVPPIIIEKPHTELKYNKYFVAKSFTQKLTKKKVFKPKVVKKKEYQLINNIILKAIYAMSNNRGFITISEKSSSNLHTLSVGDKFKSYILKSIYPTYVIFTKGSNEYKLSMIEATKNREYTITPVAKVKALKNKEEIIFEDGMYTIDKNLINRYTKDFDQIWREIAITEVEKNGKIEGFLVGNLSKNSIFKKLGLKIGDIIKSVNNIKLKSYSDAFELYKKMNDTNSIHIILIRNNKQMELDYEIK
jgi:general secretion pathway protein C